MVTVSIDIAKSSIVSYLSDTCSTVSSVCCGIHILRLVSVAMAMFTFSVAIPSVSLPVTDPHYPAACDA